MSTISELVISATDAVVHGARFQTHIREALEMGATASDLAEFTTKFKRSIDAWVKVENTQVRRKKVNNIINDVARICREELGETIVCVSKKPDYVYETRPIKERVPSVGITEAFDKIFGITPHPTDALEARIKELESELKVVQAFHGDMMAKLTASPESAIDFLRGHHSLEEIGRAVVVAMKAKEESPF